VSAQDLYAILGVAKTATQAEIKKAYVKLARTLHPDVNPGDKASEQRFKEVSSAYDVLSDPEKRALYDEFGEDATRAGFDPEKARAYKSWQEQAAHGGGLGGFGGFEGGGVEFDLGDLFGDALRRGRGGRRRAGPRPGADLKTEISVSFMEAARGGSRELGLQRPTACSACGGGGRVPAAGGGACPACGGSGATEVSQGPLRFHAPCRECEGTGQALGPPCSACGGQGQRVEEVHLSVTIPAGVKDGQTLRLGGQGSAGAAGGPAGDLYVTVRVQLHPLFTREGDDVHLEVPITVREAMFGGKIDVPTLTGEVELKVPAGSQTGRRMRLRGLGIKGGDLYVTLAVKVPSGDGAEAQKAADALEALYTDDVRASLKARG
jgi:molecular chaperone DnaJ